MKLRFVIDKDGERITTLWSEQRQAWLNATEMTEDVEFYLTDEATPGCAARRRIEAFTASAGAEAVEDYLMLDMALPSYPSKLICLGKSYADHAKEFDGAEVKEPAIFMKAVSSITSCDDEVLNPPGCVKLDYEVELAVLIGELLKNATVEQARKAICGYTLMCDYSERANQLEHGGQWTKGKSYDTFAPVGPCLITKDELGDGGNIPLELKVNGELRQQGNTNDLMMSVPELVAYVSRFMTLWPGDVIATGTPGGVGMGMQPPQFLKAGDVVEWGSPVFGYARQTVVNDSEE